MRNPAEGVRWWDQGEHVGEPPGPAVLKGPTETTFLASPRGGWLAAGEEAAEAAAAAAAAAKWVESI